MICYFSIVSILVGKCSAEPCTTPWAVRLVWGSGNWEGFVQVCYNGTWGWVCYNDFSDEDAQVVCNQLGFSTSGIFTIATDHV